MNTHCNTISAQVYTCHISAYQLTELQHRLEVRTRPVIITEPEEVLVVREGSPASLSCRAVSGITTGGLSSYLSQPNEASYNFSLLCRNEN